jgi:hypothetical protein
MHFMPARSIAITDPVALTRRWLERAVIGLNLCPFAKSVYVRQQVRFVLSDAVAPAALLETLVAELEFLRDADPRLTDTTLLIHPHVLADFLDYNDFLDRAEAALTDLDLDGEIQIASFHPDYRFADSGEDAVENCTNRSPFPTLHLLREASVERAVEAFSGADAIVDRNKTRLRGLGMEGWLRLMAEPVG